MIKRMNLKTVILAVGFCLTLCACSTRKAVMTENPVAESEPLPTNMMNVVSPPVVIYKMRGDYARLVPVQLDARGQIISYPDPLDLRVGGKLSLPTPLHGGYWLDNRGITAGVAFVDYTYEEYSRLKEAPSKEELQRRIVDSQPLTEIRECGRRHDYDGRDLVDALNVMIDEGRFSITLKLRQ